MRSLLGALGFLTTLPAGRDSKSFEAFRRKIYVMPFAGLISGLICSAICLFLSLAGVSFLAPLAFLAVEGINHLDGLSDFGDAVFAPSSRKVQAMKDVNTGAGGTVAVVLWALSVSLSSARMNAAELALFALFAEVCGKSGMLLALTTSRAAWEGMGSYMMEFAEKKTTALSLAFVSTLALIAQLLSGYPLFYAYISSIVLSAIVVFYSVRTFGGVSGDIFGAINCLAIASCMVFPSLKFFNLKS